MNSFKMIQVCCIALFIRNAASTSAPAWDVVVYGSSPAGIAAATAAGHLGLRVAVYEPLEMIGGMGIKTQIQKSFVPDHHSTRTPKAQNIGCERKILRKCTAWYQGDLFA